MLEKPANVWPPLWRLLDDGLLLVPLDCDQARQLYGRQEGQEARCRRPAVTLGQWAVPHLLDAIDRALARELQQ
jgi:hypothetical protein